MNVRILVASTLVFVAAGIGLGQVHLFESRVTQPAKGRDSLLQKSDMPAEAKSVLIMKCADCHSNETRWPIYAKIAPASWLIERDIAEGRKHMNLSEWEQYSLDKQHELEAKIVNEAKKGHMPPPQYWMIHWDARLTSADIHALAGLSKGATGDDLSTIGPANADRGRMIFEKRCTGCHALTANREGPRLAGVYGRKAGSVPEFSYTAGLKRSGFTWSEETLDKWLNDPDSMVPDNNMSFSVAKAQDRRDLIAFLKK